MNRAEALTVPCTYCKAAIGEPCTNLRTKKILGKPIAHTCRIDLAEQEVPF